MAYIAVILSVLGILSCSFQVHRLRKTFRTQKRGQRQSQHQDEDKALSSADVRTARSGLRSAHKQTVEALAAEVQTMKNMQREVKDHIAGLQKLVTHISEKQGKQVAHSKEREKGNFGFKSD